ncbi:hypothetical protein [Bradyrhizobium arachidis]|uniref:hypothetical protein n=1 Tax=Bradyrhizobium arachidis TaxID=858423 RepID=UPI001160DD8F|nr:hypothetical protein [Bradyrhizobium arachidis]
MFSNSNVGDRLSVKTRRPEWEATKSAALYMLRNGLASYKEIAELSGCSKQVVRIWGIKVDAPKARKRHLQQAWTRAKQSRG